MKAQSIRLHNFRSIGQADLELDSYGMLVGPNNAGKSNMLAAIRVFYEKGIKFEEDRDFPKFAREDEESWIEIEYKPSDQEIVELKEEYRLPNGCFRVRKYLRSRELESDGSPRTGIYAYVQGQLSDSRFYGAKNVQQGKFGEVVFIPAVSRLDEYTKLSGPSALRDLLNAILKGVLDASEAYQSLARAFSEFGDKLKFEKTSDGLSLHKLETEITREISGWGLGFELLINTIPPDEIVRSLVGHQILDESLGRAQDPSAYGQGFQRHLIFTLIRLAASYEPAARPPSRREFSPDLVWLLFEEPEAFLHPPQMGALNENLRVFASREHQQVTISTHSPQFASLRTEDLPALVRLSREGAKSEAAQIRRGDLPRLIAANQAYIADLKAAGVDVTAADETAEMESIKYLLWLNPVRAAAFFAERVLLVEGASEYGLINALLGEGKLRLPAKGTTVLDTLGMYNTHRFMNLLGGLRIPHAVLYDRDDAVPTNVALQKAIGAAQNDYTRAIGVLDRSLENELGIASAKRPDRKPQHVLWCLKEGKISGDRLAGFCEKIQRLLDS